MSNRIKNTKIALLFAGMFCLITLHAQDENLMLHYTFKTSSNLQITDDSGNGYNAELKNDAQVKPIGQMNVLDLGSSDGYLDLKANTGNLIDDLSDFTISTCLFIDESTDLGALGNFIWNFGNSDNMATARNGSMFFSAREIRYAISEIHWTGEEEVRYGQAFPKGEWKHVAYTQTGTTGKIYIDGVEVESGNITIAPGDLGTTAYNFLGRSAYSSDNYLKNAVYADFRIYNTALNGSQLLSLADTAAILSGIYLSAELGNLIETIHIENLDAIVTDITLPVIDKTGIATNWSSSDESYITNAGKVTRPEVGEDPVEVDLTVTLTAASEFRSKTFTATVLPLYDDATSVSMDAESLTLEGNLDNLRENLHLPTKGIEGSSISWSSDQPEFLTDEGEFLKLSPKGSGKQKVILTATLEKGAESTTKEFEIFIAEDEGYSAYLFSYFTGNSQSQEQIRFAISNDGYTYKTLNNNNPIIASDTISRTGGVRDPHIYRGPDNKFYMVVTDMVSANGWSSNRGMVLLKSDNLVDWTHSTVHIPTAFPDQFSDVLRVWAPQSIYDEQAGKHMVYFSMLQPGGVDIIYYAYTNDDFTALETVPQQLYFSPTNGSCIDGDIIPYNDQFHIFFKTEGAGNGIKKAVSDKLTEGYVQYDEYLDQNASGVEGSGVFKLINSDTYILMYDVYTAGYYEFTESDDLLNFEVTDKEVSMDFHPRHGTVIPITQEEAERLVEKWGQNLEIEVNGAENKKIKQINIDIDNAEQEVYIPVNYGTDLTSFDPGLKTTPGSTVSPEGETNFSLGSVLYQVSLPGGESKTYRVTASVDNNPVVEGYYADPEIIYSMKTGKFHLYPTSDGYDGWSGTYFKSFSSPDLVNWTDEGVILDLETDISWTSRNAWAPTIIERKIDGKYKYYYYFSAAQMIGVAVADDPSGPFVDSGEPLIDSRPSGVSGGQQIDPDVFHDPVSDKYYLYWGNGYMACAELNDDMVSIDESTIKVMTPNSTYREGTEVFLRNGKYYFLWSENDTRSEDYRVRYATADSPTGPLDIPASNMVIQKNISREIYGTGHNSVIQVPGKDEWYIVYHRFNRPKGITMGEAAGYNREVCIDKLEFSENGSIIQTQPTLKGINPVDEISTTINAGKIGFNFEVHPNPASDNIIFRIWQKENIPGELRIYNIYGEEIAKLDVSSSEMSLDVSQYKPGIYIMDYIQGSNILAVDKLVIN